MFWWLNIGYSVHDRKRSDGSPSRRVRKNKQIGVFPNYLKIKKVILVQSTWRINFYSWKLLWNKKRDWWLITFIHERRVHFDETEYIKCVEIFRLEIYFYFKQCFKTVKKLIWSISLYFIGFCTFNSKLRRKCFNKCMHKLLMRV